MPDTYRLTHETLSLTEVVEEIRCKEAGAVVSFLGTTRDTFQGKQVLKLEYEAYGGMAEKEMRKLGEKAKEKWPGSILGIGMVHRLGEVPPGEASVVIVVASIHRREGIEGMHYLVDGLKETVPIWKKEVLGDGVGEWR